MRVSIKKAAKEVDKYAGERAVLVTVGILIFLAVKALVMSKGDVTTALAVLQAAPVAGAVTGAFLSAVSIVLFVAVVWSLRDLLAKHDKRINVIILVIGLFGSAVVSPGWVWIASICAGILWAVVSWLTVNVSWMRRMGLFLLWAGGLVIGGTAAYLLLYAVWLPHEEITKSGTITKTATIEVGYVLDDGNGVLTLLTSPDREVERIADVDVKSRTVCEPTSDITGWPWDPSSIWQRASWLPYPKRPDECSPSH